MTSAAGTRAAVVALVAAGLLLGVGGPVRAAPAAGGPEGLDAVEVALTPVLQLDAPMALATRAGTDDLYAAERAGVVVHLVAGEDGSLTPDPTPVLDLTDRTTTDNERGLLGLAFSPDGGHLYAHYTNPQGDTRLVEYAMAGEQAVVASRRTLLRVAQPFPNHNGGQLAFGPDGRLYLGLGDGGSGGDPLGNGQDTTVLLGKILRIDPTPSGTRPYTVPRSNPFVGGRGPAGAASRPEIWIYGVRNPWRFSFDHATGALWIADVGQDSVEEIDRLPRRAGTNAGRGANLGWARMEGDQPFAGATEPTDHTRPLFTYPHGLNNQNGCAVTGGYVYRGSAVPALGGAYVYGDLCRGQVRAVRQRGGTVVDERGLGVGVGAVGLVGFAEDGAGELYTLGGDGWVSRLDPLS